MSEILGAFFAGMIDRTDFSAFFFTSTPFEPSQPQDTRPNALNLSTRRYISTVLCTLVANHLIRNGHRIHLFPIAKILARAFRTVAAPSCRWQRRRPTLSTRHFSSASKSPITNDSEVDVIILGAGPAGLAAARHLKLSAPSTSFLILEPRSRIGGRVFSAGDLGAPIDAGASWLHHYGAETNPIAALAWEERLPLGKPLGKHEVFDAYREPITPQQWRDGAKAFGAIESKHEANHDAHCAKHHSHEQQRSRYDMTEEELEAIQLQCDSHDVSIAKHAGIEDCLPSNASASLIPLTAAARSPAPSTADYIPSFSPNSTVESRMQNFHVSQIQIFEACSFTELSASHWADALGMDQDMQTRGFQLILQAHFDKLGLGKHTKFNTEAVAIQYDSDGVSVECVDVDDTYVDAVSSSKRKIAVDAYDSYLAAVGKPSSAPASRGSTRKYRAKFVICTVPLGLLKENRLAFDPPLPHWKQVAIDRLGYGGTNKIILQFDKPFWLRDTPEGGKENLADGMSSCCLIGDSVHDCMRIINISGLINPEGEQYYQSRHQRGATSSTQSAQEALTGGAAAQELNQMRKESPQQYSTYISEHEKRSFDTPLMHPLISAPLTKYPYVLACFPTFNNPYEAERWSDEQLVQRAMRQIRHMYSGSPDGVNGQQHRQVPSVSMHMSSTVLGYTDSPHGSSPTAFLMHQPRGVSESYPAVEVPEPIGYIVTRWGLDAFARGAYSHFQVGSSPVTCELLARPLARSNHQQEHGVGASEWYRTHSSDGKQNPGAAFVPRLLFAGEHTYGKTIGCADSAWHTGVREAERVIQLLQQANTRLGVHSEMFS